MLVLYLCNFEWKKERMTYVESGNILTVNVMITVSWTMNSLNKASRLKSSYRDNLNA